MRLPSTNPVTLKYGATSPPYTAAAPHAGTDYAGADLNSYAPEQVKITAFYPYDGVNPCGNQLDMVSMDGARTYRFCHSSEVYAKVGMTYAEGTVLAKEGAVGYAFGVHLHFVMWVNGVRVDGDATIKSMKGTPMETINEGDLVNIWNLFGIPLTQADKDAWLGKSFKELVYSKIIPQMSGKSSGVDKASVIAYLQANLK